MYFYCTPLQVIILDNGEVCRKGSQNTIVNIENKQSKNESEVERASLRKQVAQQRKYEVNTEDKKSKSGKSAESSAGKYKLQFEVKVSLIRIQIN